MLLCIAQHWVCTSQLC